MSGARDIRRPLGAFIFAVLGLLTAGPAGAHPQDLVKWRPIVAGEAEAKKAGKLVLYFFTADWCGPCHLLEQQVFSQKAVADQIAKDYVPVIVRDVSRETGTNAPEMLKLADRYGLRGFPTLVVSRPGFGKGVTMEGWDGPALAIEFLKGARQRFLTAEKDEKKKRT
jgi:thiol:disulfide interchange protein